AGAGAGWRSAPRGPWRPRRPVSLCRSSRQDPDERPCPRCSTTTGCPSTASGDDAAGPRRDGALPVDWDPYRSPVRHRPRVDESRGDRSSVVRLVVATIPEGERRKKRSPLSGRPPPESSNFHTTWDHLLSLVLTVWHGRADAERDFQRRRRENRSSH